MGKLKTFNEWNYQMSNIYSNPFSGINAAQLTDENIMEYWCNPFSFDLFSGIKEEDIYLDSMNIVFFGGRSSGKSMFLRYWSYTIQKKVSEQSGKSLFDCVIEKSGVGFYFRLDGAKLRSFIGSDIPENQWASIFSHYFELLVSRQYILFLKTILNEERINQDQLNEIVKKISILLERTELKTIGDILEYIDQRLLETEHYIGDVPFHGGGFKPKDKIFISNSLIQEIPTEIISVIDDFRKVNFVILLDEYENFLEYQQRVLNTLLKFSNYKIKFRIGMRLEGFRTDRSISDDDFIKENREYRSVFFEELLRKDDSYNRFLEQIARRRLESIPQFRKMNILEIRSILGDAEDNEKEALKICTDKGKKIIDYYSVRKHGHNLSSLINVENPLMTLLNCILYERGNDINFILKAMGDFISGQPSEEANKYKNDYVNKYKLSLTFLLASIYKTNKMYYSFNTFCYLSSGIVGHFIELCRRSFALASWSEGEVFLSQGRISDLIQSKAAYEFSNLEKSQISKIETYGGQILTFVNNVGNLFKQYHIDKSIKYPETNQFALNIGELKNKSSKEIIRTALKWSIVQKKPLQQRSGPSETKQDTYILCRIFAPAFEISFRTRGGKSEVINEERLIQLTEKSHTSLKPFINSELDSEIQGLLFPED